MGSRCVSVTFSLLEILVSPGNGHSLTNREQGEWRESLMLSHSIFKMEGGIKPASLIYQWGQSHLLVIPEQEKKKAWQYSFPGQVLLLSDLD